MAASHPGASFVGTIPERYDRYLGPVIFDPSAADLSARVDPSALPVLEIASGTGRLTAPLLRRLSLPAVIAALDLNIAMQQIARRRIVDRRMRLVTGDAMRLPFPAAAFGQAVCQYGVMFFPDKGAAASEVRRVLKPGGAFTFNVLAPLDRNPLGEIAHRVIARFLREPMGFFHIVFGYNDFDRIRADLALGGFPSVDITTVDLTGVCESATELAQGLVTGSPVATVIAAQATAPPEQIVTAVAEELQRQFGPEPFRVPTRAHVVRAAWR